MKNCPKSISSVNLAQFDLDSDLAQVVIGVRRSGKSMLCLKVLKKSGKNFGYGDFDYLFLDEVQNVTGWHLWVNKLLRQGIHIILTGSNAKLLSSDLATHLTGRYNEIPLFPFSFEEFCHMKGLDTKDLTLLPGTDTLGYFRGGPHPEFLLQGRPSAILNI